SAIPGSIQDNFVDVLEVPVTFTRRGDQFCHGVAGLARRIYGRRSFSGHFDTRAGRCLPIGEPRKVLAEDAALQDRWSDKSSFETGFAVQAIEAGHLTGGVEAGD